MTSKGAEITSFLITSQSRHTFNLHLLLCMAALCFQGFQVLSIEVAFDAHNVFFTMEYLEAVQAEANFALVAFKHMGSVSFATSSPTMQSTS
jgi:hypothetical protein